MTINKTTLLFKHIVSLEAANKADIKMKQTKPTLPSFVGIQSKGITNLHKKQKLMHLLWNAVYLVLS